MKKKIILIGGGGHATSMLNLIYRNYKKSEVIGYTDKKKTNLKIKYLGSDLSILSKKNFFPNTILMMAIGTHIELRSKLFTKYKSKNFKFLTIIDKSAVIGLNAKVLEGSAIFPQTCIGPEVHIGENVVVHSGSIIEHDSRILSNSYIGPGAVICGHSKIEKNVLIGAKSCVLENVLIKQGCKLGAGGVMIKSINKKNQTFIGIPAK
jgi:UDP-4-amino-4,6-dideoxy-N-acetyl-beta-L-idosamine acetyltransferase|tara:strand:+ start:158 stop:778 length:621 start_codon:yes stop_codon:yes gene_type:complete